MATSEKKLEKKPGSKKNKLGVKNSLVNNINAKKKKDSTVSKVSYMKMEDNWDKDEKKKKK